jgi:hypothetical protein
MIGSTVDPGSYAIQHFRGNDQEYDFDVVDADGNALDITNWSFFFTVKDGLDDNILDAKFQKTLGSGISVINGPAGQGRIKVTRGDVGGLAGDFVYDLLGIDETGDHHTLNAEAFVVPKNVTTDGTAGQPSVPNPSFPGFIVIGSAIYIPDSANPLSFYRVSVISGALDIAGPSPTIPF